MSLKTTPTLMPGRTTSRRGGEPMGADRPEIRPEARKRARDVFAEAENFFKALVKERPEKIDFKKAEAERQALIELLSKSLSKDDLNRLLDESFSFRLSSAILIKLLYRGWESTQRHVW
jgi:hypothetical protein